MDRNTTQHFALNPTMSRPRSKFSRPQEIKLTGNVGDLIPFYVDEVLPGDTFKIKTSKVVRLQTPVTPFMDNLYLDTYYFFVPNRLVWSNWQHFMGESDQAWTPQGSWTVPQITSPASTGWNAGTIADYLGVPIGKPDLSVNALPFRAYAKICQDWFVWTPTTDPLNIPVTDSTQTGTNGSSYINDVANGGKPFVAKKFMDYFTACLPAPQRGPATTINLTGNAPVYGTGYSLGLAQGAGGVADTLINYQGNFASSSGYIGTKLDGTGSIVGTGVTNSKPIGIVTKTKLDSITGSNPDMTGLKADLTNLSMVTINELRQAFQIQRWYESLARGGDRYISIIKEMFDVTSPDARLQRSEYLGGNRVPMQVSQVLATTDATSQKLGKTGAYSLTVDSHFDVDKSFVEHGFVLGVMVVRYHHTYQQGIERFFNRSTKFDYFWPVFQNLGEQGVKNKEIYAQGSTTLNPSTGKAYDEEIFGYQEAWAEYRYKANRVAGEMRSDYTTPLDSWHLADDYNSLPALSDSWIREDKGNVDRVLTVTSSVSNQFFGDIYVENESIRPMPIYSIPGLMDHN